MSAATAQPGVNGKLLLPHDLEDLHRSSLTDDTIRRAGLYSETNPRELGRLLGWRKEYENGPALVIPFFDADGKPTGFARLKPRTPRPGGAKYENPKRTDGPPYRLYIPPAGCTLAAVKEPAPALVITEGEKKALAADQHGIPTVALPGVWCWHLPRPKNAKKRGYGPRVLLPDLEAIPWQARTVTIVFDSDAAHKPDVQRAAWYLAKALKRRGAVVKVTFPEPGPGGPDGKPIKVGIDDLLAAHGVGALRELLDKAPAPVKPPDKRPVVTLSVEEHDTVEQAVKALAKGDRRLYQRGGQLVRVLRPSGLPNDKRLRPSGGLRIEPLPQAELRLRICRHACCEVVVEKEGKEQVKRAHPTDWLVDGVAALGTWRGIRHLEAVVEVPVLRSDGTILSRPGYDRETGILYRPSGSFPSVAPAPSQEDAARACTSLLEVFCDFPFARPEHRAACLSGLLTPLARFAFRGPAPLHNIDANVRGAGKGLLADALAYIVSAREFARATYTHDNAEMGKTITALALSGERLVLLDNLTGTIGGACLDAALTATEWQGRILGKSQQPRVPLQCTWYGTGNNCIFRADTARRVLQIRLESSEERPEERSGFTHPDLLAWVRQERARLLVSALTILVAYCRAGCPVQSELKPWGSFEGWSALVRSAIVWAGQADPGLARMSAVEGGDREAAALQGLLAGWQELDPDNKGLTIKQALDLLKAEGPEARPYETMRSVLADIFDLKPGQMPSSGQLGYRLRAFAGRNCGGKCFVSSPGGGGVMRWRVRSLADGGQEGGGDGGDSGDVSATSRARARDDTQNSTGAATETSPLNPPSPPPSGFTDKPIDGGDWY
jgi:hypothetical protein